MGGGRVEVISSKGCSRTFGGFSPSLSAFKGLEPMSSASSTVGSETMTVHPGAPFAGLVICVTGLSKEARKQVMETIGRLSGQYSPDLHLQCTHLVVQNYGGRKLEHGLKYGARNGLFVVTFGWLVDSVRKNVRLSESLYSFRNSGDNEKHLDELNRLVEHTGAENSCFPVSMHTAKQLNVSDEPQRISSRESRDSTFSDCSIYVDSDVSSEMQDKVVETTVRGGASLLKKWFVGCSVSHVVCEVASVGKYLGHSANVVTPLWILKTAKEKHMQRLVHMSADLARQVGMKLEDIQTGVTGKETTQQNNLEHSQKIRSASNHEERMQIVNSAKNGVRNRRGRRMQTCQTPIRPITPSNLLDNICWTVSEPPSTASIYIDSLSAGDANESPCEFFYANGVGKTSEASFANSTRPLSESEKSEVVCKNNFLTILFPVDRFSEMGPSSRTFFSANGFTCLQVLAYIFAFYQENLSDHEIEAAIHTDSRHADRIRSVYASKEAADSGCVKFKRIEFLGIRRSLEMLKRVSGDNSCNVYELVVRA